MNSSMTLFGIRVEILALIISVIAIIFTFLKDFFLPLIYKPKLEFKYEENPPTRRKNVNINRNPDLFGTFLRFSVKNIGRRPAFNCRCHILDIKKNHVKYGDYEGFPLRWASRPESVINQASGERLNISIGETEFIDLAVTTNENNLIHFQKYHDVDIGIRENLEFGKYDILLIFSGDNFKPYQILFEVDREDSLNPDDVKLKLIETSRIS